MTYQEQEFKDIQQATGMQGVNCSCKRCVSMCKTACCIGTPSDIIKLIEAGHAEKLTPTLFCAGKKWGVPEIEMLQPQFDNDRGQCVFLNDLNLCSLHESGLKPTEGKLADCRINEVIPNKGPLPAVVALTWRKDLNKVAEAFVKWAAVTGSLKIK